MTAPTLFDLVNPAPAMADTSLACFERILPTLQARVHVVYLALCDYIAHYRVSGATGGELTEWMVARGLVRDVNGVRPRLTGLRAKGYVERGPVRLCLAYGSAAHPYQPLVPRSAVERAVKVKESYAL